MCMIRELQVHASTVIMCVQRRLALVTLFCFQKHPDSYLLQHFVFMGVPQHHMMTLSSLWDCIYTAICFCWCAEFVYVILCCTTTTFPFVFSSSFSAVSWKFSALTCGSATSLMWERPSHHCPHTGYFLITKPCTRALSAPNWTVGSDQILVHYQEAVAWVVYTFCTCNFAICPRHRHLYKHLYICGIQNALVLENNMDGSIAPAKCTGIKLHSVHVWTVRCIGKFRSTWFNHRMLIQLHEDGEVGQFVLI